MNQQPKKPMIQVVLTNGQIVTAALFDDIKRRMEEIVPAIQPNAVFTAKQLYGRGAWEALSKREKHLAGMCLYELVKSEHIPLMLTNCIHSANRRYCLKTTNYSQGSQSCQSYS